MSPGVRARRALAPVATVLLLGVVLAGCLGDGLDFGTLATAAWEPGYAWEWDVESEQSGDFQGPEGTGSGTMRFTSKMHDEVVALAETTAGSSVYILRSGGGVEPGSDDVRLRVVAQEDLATLAVAYGDDLECLDGMRLHGAHHAQDLLPLLDFPLEAGAEYTVGWEGMEWTVKVSGQERIDVPAGRFDAVRLDFETASSDPIGVVDEPVAQPASEPEASPSEPEPMVEEYVSDEHVEGKITIWYAAAAHNIVRAQMEMAFSATEDEESYSFTESVRMELYSLSLDVVENPELEPIRMPTDRDRRWIEPPALRIVTDTVFPLNSAEGNTTATFWLEEFDRRGPQEEGIPVRDVVAPYEPSGVYEGHTVRWTLASGMHLADTATPGGPPGGEPNDTFTVEFPLYGDYHVQAWIEPPEPTTTRPENCTSRGHYDHELIPLHRSFRWPIAEARAEVRFEDTYAVEHPAGLAQAYGLARFEVPHHVGNAMVEYMLSMHQPVPADDVHVLFVSPNGEEFVVDHGASIELAEPGEWIVEWRGYGQSGSGLSTGHDAQIRLQIQSQWAY